MFGFSNVSFTWSLADLHTAEEIEHSLICQSSFLVAPDSELLLASLAECGVKASGVTAYVYYVHGSFANTPILKNVETEVRGFEVRWLVSRLLCVGDDNGDLSLFNDTVTIILS